VTELKQQLLQKTRHCDDLRRLLLQGQRSASPHQLSPRGANAGEAAAWLPALA
jgi:hypothetical protein